HRARACWCSRRLIGQHGRHLDPCDEPVPATHTHRIEITIGDHPPHHTAGDTQAAGNGGDAQRPISSMHGCGSFGWSMTPVKDEDRATARMMPFDTVLGSKDTGFDG